ncbi:MAG: Asp-tRNA(Asn)/Glu-tRNA(Gln) amidotransferase subunit GatC [Patescibacteria group bacterium]
MPITHTDIEHLAKLSRLQLTVQEISQLTNELANILDYVKKVNELASKVTSQSELTAPALRADQVSGFMQNDQLIVADKADNNKLIKVPPVFGQDK